MKNKIPIDEKQLDELLKGLYLDERSKTIDEEDAQFVMEQIYDAEPDPVKEQQLLSRLNKKSSGPGAYQFFLTVLLVIAAIAFFIPFFIPQKSVSGKKETKISILTNNSEIAFKKNDAVFTHNINTIPSSQSIRVISAPDTFGKIKAQPAITVTDSASPALKESAIQALGKNEIAVPFLTEEDKARFQKVKNLMLSKLFKADKGLYTHIAADKMEYRDSVIIMEPFSIRNMSVTNLEYKTFLADLIVQNRKDDYFKAELKFNNPLNRSLSIDYFQSEKYNDFPVVNITTEGAKLFCNWLEEEMKGYIIQNKLKAKTLQIRLPFDEEWIFVARQGYAKVSYDKNGYNTIFDLSEGLVDKFFGSRLELITRRVKRSDTLFPYFSTNRYGWNEPENFDFFKIAFNSYGYLPADTIYPARMKSFCKVGHVSEITMKKNSQQAILVGMTWKQKEDYLKLTNDFKSATASPFVGFRFIVLDSNDSEYKNPFW